MLFLESEVASLGDALSLQGVPETERANMYSCRFWEASKSEVSVLAGKQA